jgi:hypothetical protein
MDSAAAANIFWIPLATPSSRNPGSIAFFAGPRKQRPDISTMPQTAKIFAIPLSISIFLRSCWRCQNFREPRSDFLTLHAHCGRCTMAPPSKGGAPLFSLLENPNPYIHWWWIMRSGASLCFLANYYINDRRFAFFQLGRTLFLASNGKELWDLMHHHATWPITT